MLLCQPDLLCYLLLLPLFASAWPYWHHLACWVLKFLHKCVKPTMLVPPLTVSCKVHCVPTAEGEDSAAWAGWDDVGSVQTTQAAKKKQDTDDWGKW